jgi:hypothetical protein
MEAGKSGSESVADCGISTGHPFYGAGDQCSIGHSHQKIGGEQKEEQITIEPRRIFIDGSVRAPDGKGNGQTDNK